MVLQPGDQQRVIERPGHQGGNQAQLLVAEAVKTVRIHAVEGERADQGLPGKQRQADAGVHLQALLSGDQAIVRVRQIAIRREAHHIPRPGNRLQPRVAFKGKASAKHVLGQAINRQRHKLVRLVAQQRRSIAAEYLPQGGNQTRKTVGMAEIAL